jgi:hypothetical protein
MPGTDYVQVLAADEARNEVGAISFVVGASCTALLSCYALHEWRSYIRGQRLSVNTRKLV